MTTQIIHDAPKPKKQRLSQKYMTELILNFFTKMNEFYRNTEMIKLIKKKIKDTMVNKQLKIKELFVESEINELLKQVLLAYHQLKFVPQETRVIDQKYLDDYLNRPKEVATILP